MKTQMVMAGRAVARPIMEDLSGMERLVEQILDRPQQAYTKRLLGAIPRGYRAAA